MRWVMSQVEMTTTSPKGQVVIPQEIREKMKIVEGTKFAVYGSGDTIIFKKMELPSVKEFEKIVDFGVKFAKKRGITEKDVLEGD